MVVVGDEVRGAITVLFVLEDALPLQRLHALLLLPAPAPAQGVVAAGAGAVLSLQQPLPWTQVKVVGYLHYNHNCMYGGTSVAATVGVSDGDPCHHEERDADTNPHPHPQHQLPLPHLQVDM